MNNSGGKRDTENIFNRVWRINISRNTKTHFVQENSLIVKVSHRNAPQRNMQDKCSELTVGSHTNETNTCTRALGV